MSGVTSYDVYVKEGVDRMGRDDFGEAVAHFLDRNNAVALKRRLEARRETVHVVKSVLHGFSEEDKERWFWDYSRVPEYDPALEPAPYREPSGGPRASWKSCMGKTPAALRGAREDSEPRRRSWRWGSFRFS
jgi:hypothetical protein